MDWETLLHKLRGLWKGTLVSSLTQQIKAVLHNRRAPGVSLETLTPVYPSLPPQSFPGRTAITSRGALLLRQCRQAAKQEHHAPAKTVEHEPSCHR
jgi:hypothetical protein